MTPVQAIVRIISSCWFAILCCLLCTMTCSNTDLSAQIIGTSSDLLDDTTTFSAQRLPTKRYVTLPFSELGNQTSFSIISMTNRPGDPDAFYVSSQNGKIHRVSDDGSGAGVAVEWFDVNSSIGVEEDNRFHGGLRAIAFHPDFANPGAAGFGKFYASLVAESGISSGTFIGNSSGGTQSVVAEWTFDAANNSIGNYRELFRVRNPQFDHPIKQLTFNTTALPTDSDYGLLYIAHGDGSVLAQLEGTGQNLDDALGKILRINPLQSGGNDYTTPGNFFANDGDSSTLAEIFSYGHRNPHNLNFGLSSDGSSHLLVAEIGQDNIDEINIATNGANFGWGEREGTFLKQSASANDNSLGYGVDQTGSTNGDGVELLPANDFQNGYTYPVLQLDHNDPTDNGRYAVAGGPVIDGRYFYGQLAGNNVTPGGQVYSVDIDDLLSQKTFLNANEPPSALTFIDDPTQHFLEFDDDGVASTTPVTHPNLAVLIAADDGNNSAVRSDVRFGATTDGKLLMSSKRNGAVYLVDPRTEFLPTSYTVFRGNEQNGQLSDFQISDGVLARYQPGFTLNSSEAPVWLIFDGNGSTETSSIRIESGATTPGLEYTVEAFNWATNQYDVVGSEPESFNVQEVVDFAINSQVHVDSNGAVRARIGWRQVGFTLLFPWEIRIDHLLWTTFVPLGDGVVDTYFTDWVSESGSITDTTQIFGGPSTWATQPLATSDYTSGADYNFVDVTTFGVTGQWLVTPGGGTQTATIILNNVAPFNTVSIDQLFLAGGGGIDPDDTVTVNINGTTIFNNFLPGRDRPSFFAGSYGDGAPASAILVAPFDEGGDNTAGTAGPGGEFLDNRVGAWGHDSLYDLGMDPEFSDISLSGGGAVTIEIIGTTDQGNSDERIAIGNFGITFESK